MRMLVRLVIVLMTAFAQIPVFAQSVSRQLVVAFDQNEFLPYYQARADNSVNGFARDILDLFGSDEGYQMEYQVYPLNRLQQLQKQGRVDLRFPDSPLWADAQKKSVKIHYSRPVVGYVDGIYCQPKLAAQVGDGLFSILRGFTPLSFADLLRERRVQFMEAPDLKAAVAMHYKKRVNGIYGNEAVLMKLSRDGYGEKLEVQSEFPISRDNYRLSSVNHKDVIARFDRWYEKNKKEIDALLAKHQLSNYRP